MADSKVTYEQAVANLNAGGLKGADLSNAQAVLKNAYAGTTSTQTTTTNQGGGTTFNPTGNTSTSSNSEDPFIAALQKKLIDQSSLISSFNSGIDEKISQAIGGVTAANNADRARIESQFGREFGYQVSQADQQRQNVLDSRSGFATNTALLRNLSEVTDKSLKDLDQRKEELILQGNSAAASKIADLQLQSLQFKQQAMQQTFSNLLSSGQFALQNSQFQLQQSAESRATRAQSFTEQNTLAQIGLQYGVEVRPGDNIDTITARAAPFASKRQALELEQIRAQINASNANVAKIKSDIANAGKTDVTDISSLATAYNQLLDTQGADAANSLLGGVKDSNTQSKIIMEAAKNKVAALEAKNAVLAAATATKSGGSFSSYPKAANSLAEGIVNSQIKFGNWLLGY